jgi:hypothetical protein
MQSQGGTVEDETSVENLRVSVLGSTITGYYPVAAPLNPIGDEPFLIPSSKMGLRRNQLAKAG